MTPVKPCRRYRIKSPPRPKAPIAPALYTPGTHEYHAPPTFRERMAALVGGTTYRTPVGGRATGGDHLPADQAIAAALGMARNRVNRIPDENDIGPDVAAAMIFASDHRKGLIVRKIERALSVQDERICRRNRQALGYIVNASFDMVVHGRSRPRIATITESDWRDLVPMVCKILEAVAEDAIQRAERIWRRK